MRSEQWKHYELYIETSQRTQATAMPITENVEMIEHERAR